jgi:hypothetical protein
VDLQALFTKAAINEHQYMELYPWFLRRTIMGCDSNRRSDIFIFYKKELYIQVFYLIFCNFKKLKLK